MEQLASLQNQAMLYQEFVNSLSNQRVTTNV